MAYSFFLNSNGQPCGGHSVPIGHMSAMKDMMYETRNMMNGDMPDEGFQISTEELRKDSRLLKKLRENCGDLPHLNIVGSRNERDDKTLFELVIRHCVASTKKLNLTRMTINIPTDKLQVFPNLEEVTFDSCTIENESILNLNDWCPHANKLTFEGLKLDLTTYNAFVASENTFPNVKSLKLNFKKSLKLTRGILNILSIRFPMVENLEIIMCPSDDISGAQSKYNVSYQALHFKNVEKLFLRAFAGKIDKLFDYMAISNKKLKNFSFAGMAVTDELVAWIRSCKQLEELSIDWQYRAADAGCSLNNIKDTQSLIKVTLIVKYLDWRPSDIIQFARDNPHLRMLEVQGEQQHKKMKFGKKFKDLFADLIKERSRLTIKVSLLDDDREVEISENGFSEKECSASGSSDDAGDLMMRMSQMVLRLNKDLL